MLRRRAVAGGLAALRRRAEATGLLVPPRDPSALAAAIRRLQHDPGLAQRLAAAGRARVERSFSADATAREIMRIYDEVAGQVGGA